MQPIPPTVPGQSCPATSAVPIPGQFVNPYQGNQFTTYKQKAAYISGIIQMVVGILCSLFNIFSLIACSESYGCGSNPFICGYGIWCGALFFASGTLGMLSGKGNPKKNLIIATMVMSIIAAILSSVSFSLGIIDSAPRKHHYSSTSYDSNYPYGTGFRISKLESHEEYDLQPRILMSMGALVAILSFIGAITAITSSVLCCKAACCCGDNVPMAYLQFYNPSSQQSMDYLQAGYIPQYGFPANNAINVSTNPTATAEVYSQQCGQRSLGYDSHMIAGQPPPYSGGFGEEGRKY